MRYKRNELFSSLHGKISAIDPNEYANVKIFLFPSVNKWYRKLIFHWNQLHNDQWSEWSMSFNFKLCNFHIQLICSRFQYRAASFNSHKYVEHNHHINSFSVRVYMLGKDVPDAHFMVNFNECIDSNQPNQIVNQLIGFAL